MSARSPNEPSRPIRRGRPRPSVRAQSSQRLFVWGVIFVAGGVAVWASISKPTGEVPAVWRVSSANADAASQMTSVIRELGSDAPDLLRLEWPAHPSATEYRIRFQSERGQLAPVSVRSPVFLYDLESNVLRLPSSFEWEVAAVLPDGSEVVSPWRSYP